MDNDYYMMAAALNSFNNTLAQNANAIIASNTSKQDRKFSREMSDLSWQRNIEAWNMQNEYNLPSNQYARQLEGLRANGLNPNLVYGSSSSIGGAAGSVSPYKFDGYHSTAVPRLGATDPVNQILSTRLLQTQVEAQEAQARLINARADNEFLRSPGIRAKSDEAAYKWNYIQNQIRDSYDAGIRAQVATEYWKGVQTEYNAHFAKDRSTVQYYEAVTAEWLNTSYVPGTKLTYRQYMDQYKAMLPAATFAKVKAETLNFASMIAYRKSQGELLDLKKEYQRFVNRYASVGRTLDNSWVNLLISGLYQLFGDEENNEDWQKFLDQYRVGDDYQTPPTP